MKSIYCLQDKNHLCAPFLTRIGTCLYLICQQDGDTEISIGKQNLYYGAIIPSLSVIICFGSTWNIPIKVKDRIGNYIYFSTIDVHCWSFSIELCFQLMVLQLIWWGITLCFWDKRSTLRLLSQNTKEPQGMTSCLALHFFFLYTLLFSFEKSLLTFVT